MFPASSESEGINSQAAAALFQRLRLGRRLGRNRPATRARIERRRPNVEGLEARCLLSDTVITFEDLSAGTPVSDQYHKLGVDFTFGFPVITEVTAGEAQSGTKVARMTGSSDPDNFVPFHIAGTFIRPYPQLVRVYVGAFEETPPSLSVFTMTAYRSDGTQVVSNPVGSYSGAGFHAPLEVDSPEPDITSFEITTIPAMGSKWAIDDLTFDQPTVIQPDFTPRSNSSLIEVGPGQSVSDVIALNRVVGSAGDIQFAASGLPPGVTAAFAPNPAGSDSTTLTLTAAPDAPTTFDGSVTVTATPLVPGAGRAARQTKLDVHVRPDFTVGLEGPAEVKLPYITVPVKVTRDLAFQTPPIDLSVSGLPPGVTAVFDPATVGTPPDGGLINHSTLKLVTLPNQQIPATFTLDLVAKNGLETSHASFAVRVRPDFTVKLESPTEVNMTYGSSITVPVTITREPGFQTPPIDLSVSGLPNGVTASFVPPTVGAPPDGGLIIHSTLTLTVRDLPLYPAPFFHLPPNFVLDVQAKNGPQTSHASLAVHGLAPFDLVGDTLDDNGIPMNPEWGWQIAHPGTVPNFDELVPGTFTLDELRRGVVDRHPLCTNQAPTLDYARGWNQVWSVLGEPNSKLNGHLNWMPATYEGKIFWEAHSSPGSDDDYNLRLDTADQPGQTTADGGKMAIEFDSDETIDHFHTPWWNSFHDAVDSTPNVFDFGPAHALIDGKFAIVTGLLGLDLEHPPGQSELHPAYAVAIRVNDDPADETWAIFVRNWGDEGYCSQFPHPVDFPNNQYTFRLPPNPWVPGASSVSVGEGTDFLCNNDQIDWGITWAPNQGVLVSFQLPPPDAHGRINGELHLHWTGAQLRAANDPVGAGEFTTAIDKTELGPTIQSEGDPPSNDGGAEALIGDMLARMTPEKEAALEASIPRRLSTREDIVPRWLGIQRVDNLPVPSSTALTRLEAVHDPDPVKAEIDQARGEALRQALQPGHFQFGAATYSVNESGLIATIPVIRMGGSQGTVTVTFATRDGTAMARTDYIATTQMLTFSNGETTKTVTIPILHNRPVEGNKTVLLTLSDPTLVEGDQTVLLASNAITGGATLGDPQAAVLTIVNDIGPTVVDLSRFGIHRHPTRLALTFSEPLDPSRVQDLSNYILLAPGYDGRFGTHDDRVIRINSAKYDPNTRTVTLSPSRHLNWYRRYRITVKGTRAAGLTDMAGNLLDGNRDGRPGGDYVAIIRGYGLDRIGRTHPKGPVSFRHTGNGPNGARAGQGHLLQSHTASRR